MALKNDNGKWIQPAILTILSLIVMLVLYAQTDDIRSAKKAINEMPSKYVQLERYKCDREEVSKKLDNINDKLDRLIWRRVNGHGDKGR